MTILTAICITLPLMQSGSAVTAAERALVSYVDAHNDEALALLERVVNINSGTQNFDGVRQVGRLFRAEFDALGLQDAVGRRRAVQACRPSRRRACRARAEASC